jgi:hypothetical protein
MQIAHQKALDLGSCGKPYDLKYNFGHKSQKVIQAFHLDFAIRDSELGKLKRIVTAYAHFVSEVPNLKILQ